MTAEFLSNPAWLGIVIGAAGLVVALVSFAFNLRGRKRKKLSYELVSAAPLFRDVGQQTKGRLQILFDDKPIRNTDDVEVVLFKLRNSGNEPIKQEDFFRPITFDFGEQASIVSAEVSKSTEPGKGTDIEYEQGASKCVLQPVLFNPNEAISLGFTLTRFSSETFNVDGHIVGVDRIEGTTSAQAVADQVRLLLVRSFMVVLGLISVALVVVSLLAPQAQVQILLTVFTTIAGILAGFITGTALNRPSPE